MEKTRNSFYLLMLFCLCATAQQPQAVQNAVTPQNMAQFEAARAKLYEWPNYQFMLGQWRIKSAEAGEVAVERQLDGKVLTIRNTQRLFAAATTAKRASSYKSLTVIYIEGLTQRATFFDNEGNSFTYDVDSTSPNKIALVQPAGAVASRNITFSQKEGALVIEAGARPAGVKAVGKAAVTTFTAEKVK